MDSHNTEKLRKIVVILSMLIILLPSSSYSMKTKFYLCIGSFRDIATLKKYYNPLVSGNVPIIVSLNYDKGKPFYHMLYGKSFPSDSKARNSIPGMASLSKYSKLPLNDVWVFDKYLNPFDPYAPTGRGSRSLKNITEEDEYVYYHKTPAYQITVINRKGGGLEKVEEEISEKDAFSVVQIIPEKGSISGGHPLIVLFNRKILLPSIIGHFKVYSENKPVQGYLRVIPYNDNQAALCFTPMNGVWPTGSTSITIDEELQSTSGETLIKPVSGTYQFGKTPQSAFNNWNFEEEVPLLSSDGDCGLMKGDKNVISAFQGTGFCALSTGKRHFSAMESVGGKSSALSLYLPSLNGFSFAYDFLSSEFNEFAASNMGDISFIVLWGKNYQKVEIITSVNRIGINNTQLPYKRFASLPEMGDSYAGHSEWILFEKVKWKYSSPVFASFIISNIKEPAFDSVLLIDRIRN